MRHFSCTMFPLRPYIALCLSQRCVLRVDIGSSTSDLPVVAPMFPFITTSGVVLETLEVGRILCILSFYSPWPSWAPSCILQYHFQRWSFQWIFSTLSFHFNSVHIFITSGFHRQSLLAVGHASFWLSPSSVHKWNFYHLALSQRIRSFTSLFFILRHYCGLGILRAISRLLFVRHPL